MRVAKREAREFKRLQAIEGARVSFRAGRMSEVCSRQWRGHRSWALGWRSAGSGQGFSLCARFFLSGSSPLGASRRSRCDRLVHGQRYDMGYARTTGRRDGLGAAGRTPQDTTENSKPARFGTNVGPRPLKPLDYTNPLVREARQSGLWTKSCATGRSPLAEGEMVLTSRLNSNPKPIPAGPIVQIALGLASVR